ncbi:hypothetical protein FHX15_005937 [Rhizobium sp. BK650]|nr:hypothetical protein [Rhizobium sp. BK650]
MSITRPASAAPSKSLRSGRDNRQR